MSWGFTPLLPGAAQQLAGATYSVSVTEPTERWNLVSNSEAVGGGAGVLPTGWVTNANYNGMSITPTGYGVDATTGITYFEYTISGTPTAAWGLSINTGRYISPVPLTERPFSFQTYIQCTDQSIRPYVRIEGQTAGGTYDTNAQSGALVCDSRLEFFKTTLSSMPATSYQAHFMIGVYGINIGTAYDFRIRVAHPHAEESIASSEYIPTYGTIASASAGDLSTRRSSYSSISNDTTQRWNLVPNSTWQGAAAGVWPTGWPVVAGGYGGVTTTCLGRGTDIYGNQYMDIQIVANPATTGCWCDMGIISTYPILGDTCTFTYIAELLGNNLPSNNITIRGQILEYDSLDVFIVGTTGNATWSNFIGTTQRYSVTRTISSANYAKCAVRMQLNVPAGAVCDFIVRYYQPQFEISPVATEFIPTYGTIASASAGAVATRKISTASSLAEAPERWNLIPNSTFQGASAGVWPTGFYSTPGGYNGLFGTCVGRGTDAEGIDYLDIRIQGTPTAGVSLSLTVNYPASVGQVYTVSTDVEVLPGEVFGAPVSTALVAIYEYDISNAYLAASGASNISLSGRRTQTLTRTITSATVDHISVRVANFGNFTIGVAYDFTVRIRQPQLELGDVATEYIPTYGTIASSGAGTRTLRNTSTPVADTEPSQRTNLLSYSSELSQWGNLQDSTIASNIAVDPYGLTTADRVTEGSTASSFVGNTIANPNTTKVAKYTYSHFLKRDSHDWVRIKVDDTLSTGFDLYVNLATGTLGQTTNFGSGVALSSSIIDMGNGWYRASVTGTMPAAGFATIRAVSTSATGNGNSTRIAGSSRLMWGAQLEEGELTEYISTTANPVTVNAIDAYTSLIPATGIPVSTSELLTSLDSYDSTTVSSTALLDGTLSSSIETALAIFLPNIFDATSSSDLLSTSILANVLTTDSTTSTETSLLSSIFTRNITDSTSGSDTASTLASYNILTIDNTTATESIIGNYTVQLQTQDASISTDSTYALANLFATSLNTTVAADTLSSLSTIQGAILDTSIAEDSILNSTIFKTQAIDSTTSIDAADYLIQTTTLVSDSATSTDSALGMATLQASSINSTSSLDVLSAFANLFANTQETSVPLDSIYSTAGYVVGYVDSVSAYDTVYSYGTLLVSDTEPTVSIDTISGLQIVSVYSTNITTSNDIINSLAILSVSSLDSTVVAVSSTSSLSNLTALTSEYAAAASIQSSANKLLASIQESGSSSDILSVFSSTIVYLSDLISPIDIAAASSVLKVLNSTNTTATSNELILYTKYSVNISEILEALDIIHAMGIYYLNVVDISEASDEYLAVLISYLSYVDYIRQQCIVEYSEYIVSTDSVSSNIISLSEQEYTITDTANNIYIQEYPKSHILEKTDSDIFITGT